MPIPPLPLPGELAPRWQRLAASVIDSGLIVGALRGSYVFVAPTYPDLWPIALASLRSVYYVLGNMYGATLGKAWLRMVIRRQDGKPPGIRAGVRRSADHLMFMVAVLLFPPAAVGIVGLVAFLGYSPILTHENRQSIYDRFAGTFVVRKKGVAPTILI